MDHKLIYISYDDKNYWLKRLGITIFKLIKQNLVKVSKFLSQQIREPNFKTFGTCVINSPMSLPSLTQT